MAGIRDERAKPRDGELGDEPTSARSADPAPTPQNPPGAGTVPPEKPKANPRRKMLLGALGVLILAGALWFGVPWVQTTLNTVSTDDAYVNGHVTFVAARVKGQVSRVLVDDNYRVRKGDLLVQLDKEPFQIAVAIKKAAVDTATADLQVAKSKVRGIEAEAMSRRRALEHAMEDVDNQVALLRAKVAGVDKSKAELALAQVDFDRAAKLVVTNDPPRSEYDRRQAGLLSARADVVAALADVRQIRASLGLPPAIRRSRSRPGSARYQSNLFFCAPGAGGDDSERGSTRRHPFVRRGAPLTWSRRSRRKATSIPPSLGWRPTRRTSSRPRPSSRSPSAISTRRSSISATATSSRRSMGSSRAETSIRATMCRLARLSWRSARSMKSGLTPISRRRSCGDLRIGQPVDLYVDMYGGRHVFKGRISGFTDGDRIDIGAAAGARTPRATSSRWFSDCRFGSTSRLRSRQEPAVYRHVGRSLRLL